MRRSALVSGLALVLGFCLSSIGTATAEEAQGKAIHPPMPVPVMPVPEEYRPTGPAPGPTILAAPVVPTPFAPSPGPADGFEGLGDNICSGVTCTIPPDTHGAVGLDHLGRVRFMEVLNTEVWVQDDTGGAVWGPVGIDTFWGAAVNPDLDGAFDPRVHYDPFAGRWISVVCDDDHAPSSAVLMGASQTADPTALWHKTRIDVDGTNTVWADYPSVGFNDRWVVVQVNLFTMGNVFDSSQIWVFDKTQFYAGVFVPVGNFRVFGHGGTHVPATTYDAGEDLYLLQRWNGSWLGVEGRLRLYRITGPSGAPVLEWLDPVRQWVISPDPWEGSAPTVPTQDFAPQAQDPAPSNCANCPFPPCRIMANDDRIQNLVMRNGTLWTAQTVFLPFPGPPTRSSVQWWQIATDTTVLQRGRVDDPTGARFFAFPSIAVNRLDDVLLGYSSFQNTQYASGSYSFRYSFDNLGEMRDEHVMRSGDACYFKDLSSNRNRWGDYSATVVAPDDTRLWTLQEYAAFPDLLEIWAPFRDKWGTYWGMLDPSRRIFITDVAKEEGDLATTSFTFTLELKDPTGAEYAPSPLPVTVDWSTADGTALAPPDYLAVASSSVTFPAALPAPYPNPSVQQTLTVDVVGDSAFEADETFFVDLFNEVNATLDRNRGTGTILNDDPQISISDVQRIEGNGGSEATDFIFTVSLSNPSPTLVTVDWTTVDDTAVAGAIGTGDFTFASGPPPLSFTPGIVKQDVVIKVHGDLLDEGDEVFYVDLTGATGGSLLKWRGVGTIIDDDAPRPPVGAFVVVSDGDAVNGRNRLEWSTPAGSTGTQYLVRYNEGATCTPPTTPPFGGTGGFTVAPVVPGVTTLYEHGTLVLDREYCYSIWIHYGGGNYSTRKEISARPFDSTPPLKPKWKLFTGVAALSQPTVGFNAVLAPGNDKYLHAMSRGAGGGLWPAPWIPRDLGAVSQQRAPIVPLGGGWRMFISTQDGRVHSIDTANGNLIWSTQLPEGAAQGAPAGIFTAFGGAYDYILVGTSSGGANRLYALDPFTGAVIDAFPQAIDGLPPGNMGPILGMPSVDYASSRVYFASRIGTIPSTVWCLDLGPPSDALRLGWRVATNHIDGSAVLHKGRVYVGTISSEVYSLDASDGSSHPVLPLGDGPIKGFLFPDRRNSDLYVATDTTVWAITDTGSLLNHDKWPVEPNLMDPSVVLHHPGTDDIYVGVRNRGGTAAIVKIDASTGVVSPQYVSLENGPLTIGPPSLDLGGGMLHMGSVAGILYAVELGF